MAHVHLDTTIKKITQSKAKIKVNAMTVLEAIKEVDSKYPGFSQAVLDVNKNLHNFVILYVDNNDVRFLNGLHTPLNESSIVLITKVISGG